MDLRLMLLLSVITYTVVSDRCNKYNSNALKNGQYLPDLSFKQLKDSSLYSCAAACYSYTICRSFNLNQRTRTCFLNVEDITCPDRTLVHNASFIYSSIEDWDKGIAGPCERNECALLSQRCHVARNRSVVCEILVCTSAFKLNRDRLSLPGSSLREDIDYTLKFSLYNISMNWTEAKEYCSERCGRLAVVNTDKKNVQVTNLMADVYKGMPKSSGMTPNPHIYSVWLGATDRETEDQWMWVDGEEMDYDDWGILDGTQQPDNAGSQEDCLSRVKFSIYEGWNDDVCSTRHNFICEYVYVKPLQPDN